MKRALVPLAPGFEEVEAVAVVDILRRAGIDVTLAGVGNQLVEGAHGVSIQCDRPVEDCDAAGLDAVVLPGGMPGTANLARSQPLARIVGGVYEAGGLVAAICAAPTVLSSMGLLVGRRATSHPAHRGELSECEYSEDRVVVDGNVVTSRGAGTAVEFAVELVRILAGPERADDIAAGIVHR